METIAQQMRPSDGMKPGFALPYQVVPASVAAKNPAVQNPLPFGGSLNSPKFAVDSFAANAHNNIHKQKRHAMKHIQNFSFFLVGAILLAANAHAGRWITRDPMEVQEHMERDPHPFLDLNPYTFAFNSPLNAIDPDGKEAGFIYRPGGGMENAMSRNSTRQLTLWQRLGSGSASQITRSFNPFDDPKW